jgi:proteasome alpha subunit
VPNGRFGTYSDVVITPYDWQEGIGNRAQYIEGKLEAGSPVAALSLADGILLVTYRRQTRKLFEIYDRIAFAGIGQQSDVEAIRIAAVDFASREGYQRSEQDVTIQRIASAVSSPIKRAFGDFSSAPFVVRSLFAEVNETPDADLFYTVDYTGDYSVSRSHAVIAGDEAILASLADGLSELDHAKFAADLLDTILEIWQSAITPEEGTREDAIKGLKPEALLMERSDVRVDRFRRLTPEE